MILRHEKKSIAGFKGKNKFPLKQRTTEGNITPLQDVNRELALELLSLALLVSVTATAVSLEGTAMKRRIWKNLRAC